MVWIEVKSIQGQYKITLVHLKPSTTNDVAIEGQEFIEGREQGIVKFKKIIMQIQIPIAIGKFERIGIWRVDSTTR